MKKILLTIVALAFLALPTGAFAQATATPGKALKMLLVPKYVGTDRFSRFFEQAHQGAEQAARELQNPIPLQFIGPVRGNSAVTQISIVADATAQGVDAIMMTNNSVNHIVPALKAAHDKGINVVTWDFPVPSAEGEDIYVAQVDFSTTGRVMADLAFNILGPDGGKFAIRSTTPDNPTQNAWIKGFEEALKDPKFAKFEQVDIAYGNDEPESSYNRALALVAKHADLKLIMAPASIAIVAAAKAMRDRNLCGKVKVSGLGVPSEMRAYVLNSCSPQFALWSFFDLGYLAYYTAYLLASDAIKAEEGQQFAAGRMGTYTLTKDPNRPHGLRVVMGPWTLYDKTNIEAAAAR
jgi:rhamnose transport system substrate-binding protein